MFVETPMRTSHCGSDDVAQTKDDNVGLGDSCNRVQSTSHPASEDPLLLVVIDLVQFSCMKMEG